MAESAAYATQDPKPSNNTLTPSSKDVPLRDVQVDALVITRIIKHGSQTFPSAATGSLVGMDVNGTLQITNSFPFPVIESSQDGHEGANASAAAPRA